MFGSSTKKKKKEEIVDTDSGGEEEKKGLTREEALLNVPRKYGAIMPFAAKAELSVIKSIDKRGDEEQFICFDSKQRLRVLRKVNLKHWDSSEHEKLKEEV